LLGRGVPEFKRPPAVRRSGRSPSFCRLCRPSPLLDPTALPQHEVLQYELSFASGKRTSTSAAGYLTVLCLRPRFNPNHLIEGVADRAIKRRWLAARHYTSPLNTGEALKYALRHFSAMSLDCHTAQSHCSLRVLFQRTTLWLRSRCGAFSFPKRPLAAPVIPITATCSR
jgi:hypothetical protein